MRYLKYLKYVVRHKWFVFVECALFSFRNSISNRDTLKLLIRGIVHDNSKFLPDEFFPYANHFYDKKSGEGIKKGRDETGYYKPWDTGDKAFDFAWLLHQKRNRHHWQWWILQTDEEGVKSLKWMMSA